MVTNTITLVNGLQGLAITPDGTKVYVTNESNDDVSVINTSTNMVTNTISVNSNPVGIAITPDGTQVYVTNRFADNVSVINVSTNMVTNTINVGCTPTGVAITLDGTKVYVANHDDNDVSVINVGSGMVTNTVNVGTSPYAFGDFIGSSLPPLPVELIRFNARQKGEDIHLSWETAVEIDNKEFQIEHNLDSKTWHVIGFIEGAGNSYKNLTYSFVHPNPKAGDNYYRLKQLDFSGVFEYSNIVSVNRDKAQTFRIYPNPAYSVVIFDLGNQFEEAEIIIYSSLGHIVRRINTDQNLIQVNMEDLELGVYWMNLQIDGKNYRGTFVKM
jgi:YVTN family beta-propeller protein